VPSDAATAATPPPPPPLLLGVVEGGAKGVGDVVAAKAGAPLVVPHASDADADADAPAKRFRDGCCGWGAPNPPPLLKAAPPPPPLVLPMLPLPLLLLPLPLPVLLLPLGCLSSRAVDAITSPSIFPPEAAAA